MEILGSIFLYMKDIPEEDGEIDPDWATPQTGFKIDSDECMTDPVHSGMKHVDIIIGALG